MLGRVWEVLAWAAVMELRGCAVGAGDRGRMHLLGPAKLWEVRVIAGEVQQYRPGFSWVGTVYEARPIESGLQTYKGGIAI